MLGRLVVAASSRFPSQQQFLPSSPTRHQAIGGISGTSPPPGAPRQGQRPLQSAERAGPRKDPPPSSSLSSAVSFGSGRQQKGQHSSATSMNQEVAFYQRGAPCCGGASQQQQLDRLANGCDPAPPVQQPQAEAGAAVAVAPSDMQGPVATAVPVFVMLPLDTVNADGVFRYASSRWFLQSLQTLAATGIRGVAVDVWWGAVERKPRRYDWSGYRQLFNLIKALGLKIQVVMSFHACGGNVGDNAQIPLPKWVLQVGERDPDIFFTDRPRELSAGQRNKECISIFADEEPGLLKGRSPIQCYSDFMRAFREEFLEELGEWIEEVVVGCGPCGELRYPSYVETNGWRFPGIGEFQCYDRRALASLAQAACAVGHPEWGNSGPHDAGFYNSTPEETGFFCSWGGSWDSPYGRFFLSWYSGALLDHGDRMLRAAASVFNVARAPMASPPTATARWPISKPSSLWDLPATSRPPPTYPRPRLASASAPLLRHQSNSSTEEAMQQAREVAQQAQQAQQGTDVYVPSMFDAPAAAAAAAQQPYSPPTQAAQQQPYSPYTQAAQQQLAMGVAAAAAARTGDAPSSHDGPPAWAQQQQQQLGEQWGNGGPAPGPPAASPPTPPSADFAATAGSCLPPQPMSVAAGAQPAGPLSPPPVPPLQLQGNGMLAGSAPLSPQQPPGTALPSPMSVGMLSQPPSLASLRSSISESVDDLTGVLAGEPQPAGEPIHLTIKVAGVHWWFRTRAHAAELTAGYYNTETHPGGYAAIADLCGRYGASLTLTCVEMCDSQHPPEALCGPEGLLRTVREVAMAAGVAVAGENALPCFMPGSIDEVALQRVIFNTQPWGTPLQQGASPEERDALGPLAAPADMISSAENMAPWASAPGGPMGSYDAAVPPPAPGSGSSGSNPPSPTAPTQLPPLRAFTFLRLSNEMMTPDYQAAWARFVRAMQKNATHFKTSRSWRQSLGLMQQ